ncbi:DUF2490 domain-containing protein [Litoribacter ruber]|uniref:DUF2490 domain-containing protein n=1 Tax=Litoribacter ruber TaxID=702568 RepID=A0AAP2CEZ4_9BACT|nr:MULTISPECIES: DUF2490 domain-containing protein [Litoribacter]MBS9522632.1 DUF2490 domain-containing protein [Litoribacter alkaliphilus]MBT0811161.1 DUF2490 domain-containing protein [Litoribacter ruber]
MMAVTRASLFFFLFIPLFSFGQEELRETNELEQGGLYWIRYYLEWELSDKLQLDVEAENRRFFSPSRQYQFITRGTLYYLQSEAWNFGIGMAYSQMHSLWTPLVEPEIRPHQETNYTHEAGRWNFNHRLRIEQRFRGDTTRTFVSPEEVEEELESTYSFNMRYRYEFTTDFDIIDKGRKKGHLHAQGFAAIMVRTDEDDIFDTFRYYGGLRYYLTDNLRLELGYLRHLEKEHTYDFQYSYSTLRFTVRHKL